MDRKLGGIAVSLLFALASPAFSQEATCTDFSDSKGPRIQFSTDAAYSKYGFQMMHLDPESLGKTVAFERLSGKVGRIVETVKSASGIMHFRKVVMADCEIYYYNDVDDDLNKDDALFGAFTFLDDPPTTWKATKSQDRMSDAKVCSVMPQSRLPFPAVFLRSGRPPHVAVVGGDYPGRRHGFRVDKNPMVAGSDGLGTASSASVISQMRKGKRLLTSSYEWPSDIEHVKEFNLEGFSEKLDDCLAWIGGR